MRVHNTYETLSSRRLSDPKPVTRLTKKIRKDDCSKRKKSFKEKVKKIDDLTTQIQEIAEEVKDLLFELPNFDRYRNYNPFEFVEGRVNKIKENSVELYEYADDSYSVKYLRAGYDAFSNSESDATEGWETDHTPDELK